MDEYCATEVHTIAQFYWDTINAPQYSLHISIKNLDREGILEFIYNHKTQHKIQRK